MSRCALRVLREMVCRDAREGGGTETYTAAYTEAGAFFSSSSLLPLAAAVAFMVVCWHGASCEVLCSDALGVFPAKKG
jgi:hypothetical protein